jgi:gliding motility-associated-like protein
MKLIAPEAKRKQYMLKKFTLFLFLLVAYAVGQSQPLNDDCLNATPITIPASGNVCVTGSTVGATSTTYTSAVCGQTTWTNDVWFTFVSNGNLNTITLQPNGSPAASRVGVAVWQGGCANLTSLGTACAVSATNGGNVSVTQASPAGTQYWIQVSSFVAAGGFQLCVTSITPPPTPGSTCATATNVCDLANFSLASGPAGSGVYTPGCFDFGAAGSVWYQFSVGTGGSLGWNCTPTSANTELDWAVFDITNGCGTTNLDNNTVACNYNFNNQLSGTIGMSAASVTNCNPIFWPGTAAAEICPPITLTAGRTYAILIDNFSANGSGWNFNWNGSTFLMAPTSQFTLNTNKICGNSGTVTITNSSVGAASQTWNFGDGSPASNAVNPGSHTYTSPGTYIVSLTITSATGCTDVSTQSIQIIADPVITTVSDTICTGGQATISAAANPSGGTYLWNPGGYNTSTVNVSPGATTPYTVTYTSPDNCTATAVATVTLSSSAYTVNAGPDQTICANQSVSLNGSVSVPGTYTYAWTPNGTLQNANTLTPTASPASTTTYTLSVTDAGGCSKTSTVTINVSGVGIPTTATVNPTIVCPGQQVQLNVSILPVSCGPSPTCQGVNISNSIGSGTTAQPGTALQPPTLFGNYAKSGRNQMLYTAAELTAAVGGPCVLKGVYFNIAIFNSNSQLQNFTIKMACTNATSLTTWEQNLTTVFTIASYQPSNGAWVNGFNLTTPFAWDGASNLIVDVCWNNPLTYGNLNNKAECTTTPFTSYLYSSGATDQCGTVAAPTTSTLRPNMKLNSCAPDINNYSVSWSPSVGTVSNPNIPAPTANPLVTTNYTVTVANPSGTCPGTDVVTVQVDNSTVSAGPDRTSCPGAAVNLAATISGTILPGPAQYVWTTLAGGAVGNTQNVTVNPLVTTTYVVTLNGGACVKRDTVVITIGSLSPTATPTNATCFGSNNGSILAGSPSGTTPFSYVWSANAATGNSATASNLAPGNYQVTVSDATGCSGTASATITQPTQLTFTTATINDSCAGASQGSITATPNGGTPNYTYTWSGSSNSTATLSGLVAGNYSVTVRDANQCSATATVVITEPSPIVFFAPTIQNVKCFNGNTGRISVTNNGGTGVFTYNWSHDATLHSNLATNLTAGPYTVTALDANGCSATATYNVTQPATGLTIPNTPNFTSPTCHGYSDGTATVNPSGGVGTLQYLWTPSNQTTQTATGLIAQTYTVSVTDDSLCTASNTVTITEPAQIQVTGVVTDVKCFGGTDGAVDITVTAGVAPLGYNWTGGFNTQDISGVAAGNYTVTVTDANSCTALSTFTVGEPALLVISNANITPVNCFGASTGAITVIHTGGTSGYTYTWSPAGPNSATNTGLAAGNYGFTITDANLCSATATYQITQPAAALAFGAPVIVDVLCNGQATGSITVSVSGGTGPGYTYAWSPNTNTTTAAANNLAAGSYIVTATDLNGCSISASNSISQPSAITFANLPDVTPVSCFGGNDGSAQIYPTGGTGGPNYTYSWNGVPGNNPQGNLAAATYTVIVTDANSCSTSATVTVGQPDALVVDAQPSDALCFGSPTGMVDAIVTGGTLGFTYIWAPNGETTSSINGVYSGLYTVTVTDSKGCTATDGANVGEPTLLVLNITPGDITQVKCPGDKNGSISPKPTGGTTPYSFSATQDGVNFIFPDADNVIRGLASGFYAVIVNDNNGCTVVDTAFVPAPLSDSYVITTDSTSCFGSQYADGGLHIFGVTIQNGPFLFGVDGGPLQFSGDFYGLKAGAHSVLAQNNFGCDTTLQAIVPEPVDATAEILPSDTTLDLGESIQLSSSFSPYAPSTISSYSWTPALGLSCIDCPNPIATPYAKQTQYVLTITYNDHCTASATMNILVEGGKPVYIPNSFSPNGDGNNDIFQVYGAGIKTIDLKIFNRWGELVYQSNNQFSGWDGTYKGVLQNPSVFVYQVAITYLNDKQDKQVGSITLIR